LLCQQIRAVSRRTACRNSESIPGARPRLAVLGKTVVRKICLSIAGGWKMEKGGKKNRPFRSGRATTASHPDAGHDPPAAPVLATTTPAPARPGAGQKKSAAGKPAALLNRG
jgi:hypothetical protein